MFHLERFIVGVVLPTMMALVLFACTTAPSIKIIETNDALMSQGIWKDPKTGLEWQRCSLGQAWDGGGKACVGEAKKYTWDEAQLAVKALGVGWRVPAVDELLGLVRCSTGFNGAGSEPTNNGSMKTMPFACQEGSSRPTIDANVFPNTPPDGLYWIGSPNANNSNYAWSVYFNGGISDDGDKYNDYYVRAVRSG